MRLPLHLFRRHGTFYFRWSLPLKLRGLMRPAPKSEIRFSLRCHERRAALFASFLLWRRAVLLADIYIKAGRFVGYTDFMTQLKESDTQSTECDFAASHPHARQPEALAEILQTYDLPTLQRAVAALQNRGASVYVSISDCDVTLYNRHEVEQDEFQEFIDDVQCGYCEPNAKLLSSTLTDIVAATNNCFSFLRFLAPRMSLSRDGEVDYQVAKPTQPIACNITSIRVHRPDALAVLKVIALPQQTNIGGPKPNGIQNVTLSEALENWITFNTAQGKDSNWSPATAKDNPPAIRLLIDLIGDKLLSEVTSKDGDDFTKVVGYLPPNFRKKREFAEIPLMQIAEQNQRSNGLRPSVRTQEQKLQTVSSFMKFCTSKNYMDTNPFLNLTASISKSVKKQQKRQKSRVTFAHDELKLIFESDTAIEIFDKQELSSRLWLPLLSLFTGGRLAELGEIRVHQVKHIDGIDYLELEEWDDTALRLKNASATRQIPLHPTLIDLGFVSYAKSRRLAASANAALFPEQEGLEHKEGNRIVSRFFNEVVLKKIGVKTKQKVFHCFRHTVVDILKRTNEQDRFISSFIGHEDEEVQTWKDKYGDPLGAKETVGLLKYLDYPVDWSKFKALLKRKQMAG